MSAIATFPEVAGLMDYAAMLAIGLAAYALAARRAAAGMSSLRGQLVRCEEKKEHLERQRIWYWEIFSGMLARLRHRLDADSPILEDLSDYALLLQTARGDMLPPPQVFSIAEVVDAALLSARAQQPLDARVHLTASLHPAMPKHWLGQPAMMETLLRHLLLLGLKRTRSGFVCLRLEASPSGSLLHSHKLRIVFEDSGPLIQQGQLQQWLNIGQDGAFPANLAADISWLVMLRLFQRLGGTLTGRCGADGGLALEGQLSMSVPSANEAVAAPAAVNISHVHMKPPLLLVVENDRANRQTTERLFKDAGCSVFVVESHARAVELAPVLPVSAIILNAALPDIGEGTTDRLRHLAEDGVLPAAALWVAITKLSFIEFDYWRQRGVSEILLRPLQPDMLRRLCAPLKPYDADFYQLHDERLRRDLSPAAIASLPDMRNMLAAQLAQVGAMVDACVQGVVPPDAGQQAHAVKSAALSLGYFRLAALMGEIEYAAASRIYDAQPQNWAIVAHVLKSSGFAASQP